METNIAVLDRPVETEDEKMARGIAAILQALEDVKSGKLVCACDDPKCVARRNK